MVGLRSLILVLFLAGCVSYTPEQIEWRRSIDHENWYNCEQAYNATLGAWTYHRNHIHKRLGRRVRHWHIKDDLAWNNCRIVLGNEWIEYGLYGKGTKRGEAEQ